VVEFGALSPRTSVLSPFTNPQNANPVSTITVLSVRALDVAHHKAGVRSAKANQTRHRSRRAQTLDCSLSSQTRPRSRCHDSESSGAPTREACHFERASLLASTPASPA